MKIIPILCAVATSMTALAGTTAATTQSGTNDNPAGWGNTIVVKYPKTTSTFYGSAIDLSQDWNICTGSTDGGIEVHMVQEILPIQNRPGEYVVVRVYSLPDGTVLKRQLKRLSDGPVPI